MYINAIREVLFNHYEHIIIILLCLLRYQIFQAVVTFNLSKHAVLEYKEWKFSCIAETAIENIHRSQKQIK